MDLKTRQNFCSCEIASPLRPDITVAVLQLDYNAARYHDRHKIACVATWNHPSALRNITIACAAASLLRSSITEAIWYQLREIASPWRLILTVSTWHPPLRLDVTVSTWHQLLHLDITVSTGHHITVSTWLHPCVLISPFRLNAILETYLHLFDLTSHQCCIWFTSISSSFQTEAI